MTDNSEAPTGSIERAYADGYSAARQRCVKILERLAEKQINSGMFGARTAEVLIEAIKEIRK